MGDSAGRLALALGGAAIGSFLGPAGSALGAQIGFAAGTVAGNLLFAPDGQNTQGPRLDDLSVTTSTKGVEVPIVWGADRIGGNVIFSRPLREVAQTQTTGGKGGPPKSTHTSFSYFWTGQVALAKSLGASHRYELLRIWANKKLIYDARSGADTVALPGLAFNFYGGGQTDPDPLVEATMGTGNAPAYINIAHIVFNDLPLAEFGNRLPVLEFDISSSASAASPVTTFIVSDDTFFASGGQHGIEEKDGRVFMWSEDYVYLLDPYDLSDYGWQRLLDNTDPDWQDISDAIVFKNLSINSPIYLLHGVASAGVKTQVRQYTGVDQLNRAFTAPGEVSRDTSFTGSGYPKYFIETELFIMGFDSGLATAQFMYLDKNTITGVTPTWHHETPTGGQRTYGIGHLPAVVMWPGDGDEVAMVLADANTGLGGTISNGKLIKFDITTGTWGASVTFPFTGLALTYDHALSNFYVDTETGIGWILMRQSTGSPKKTSLIGVRYSDLAVVSEMDLDFDIGSGFLGTFGIDSIKLHNTISGKKIIINPRAAGGGLLPGETWIIDVITEEIVKITRNEPARAYPGYYNPDTNTYILHQRTISAKSRSEYIRLDQLTPNTVNLSQIITDYCGLAGLAASDIDVTGISQVERGYSHTRRASVRADLEPLLAAHFVDVVQSDWKLKFIPRSGAVAATLTENDLGYGDDPEPFYVEEVHPQGIDISKRFELVYRSYDGDYQPGTAQSILHARGAERETKLSLRVVRTGSEAAQLVDKLHQADSAKRQFRFTLSREFLYLDPGDVVNIPIEGANFRVRILRADYGVNGVIQCQAVEDDPEYQTSFAVTGAGLDAVTVDGAKPNFAIVLDTPLLRDVDSDHPGPYITARPKTVARFSSAVFYSSVDNLTFDNFDSISTQPDWGYMTNTASALPAVDFENWDDTTTLNVDFQNGSLSSITDAAAIAGGNAIVWGNTGRWEVVYVRNAAVQPDGTYNLTRLLRGRRGTEWAMDLHQDSDFVFVLNTASVRRSVLQTTQIGASLWYRAPASNEVVADATSTGWTIGSNPLKPYAGIGLSATFTADVAITWTRRTRRGGALGGPNTLTDGVGGTLSEDSESYEVDIFDHTGTTLYRTITATTPSVTYTSAQMSTDGADPTGPFLVKVYQMSAAVGRGFALEEVITGAVLEATTTGAASFSESFAP